MALYERLRRRRREGMYADLLHPRFTCPRCHRTSYNINDVREGYCGHCCDWTGAREPR